MKAEAEIRLFERMLSAASLYAVLNNNSRQGLLLAEVATAIQWVLGEVEDPPGLSMKSIETFERSIAGIERELAAKLAAYARSRL